MADVENGRDSPREVEGGEGEVPKARVTLTKNGNHEVTLTNKNRQSTKLNLGMLDGDLADLLTELDMDGDGQINSAELVRAMQIIKNEREGVQMWKKFAVIMGTVLAVSLLINICFTLYGIYYIVVSNKETKTRGGFLVSAQDESDDSNEARRQRARRQLEEMSGRQLAAGTKEKFLTKAEADEAMAAKKTAVRTKPSGPAVARWGTEEMFAYVNKDGTVDDDIKATFAMNFKKLAVDTFGTGNGVKRSHEVMGVQNTWIFEATSGSTELNVNCFFNENGAYVYYKAFTGTVEENAGGPLFFKKGSRSSLAETQIIHMVMQDLQISGDPANFQAITQPTAVSVTGPALANPNNNLYGIQNDWYSAEAFMYTKNRCTVTSATFKTVCETKSVNLLEPSIVADSFEFLTKEDKAVNLQLGAMEMKEHKEQLVSRGATGKL